VAAQQRPSSSNRQHQTTLFAAQSLAYLTGNLPQNSNNSISFIGSIKTRRGEQSNVFQRKSTASREDRP
jgi:hypothetical protein